MSIVYKSHYIEIRNHRYTVYVYTGYDWIKSSLYYGRQLNHSIANTLFYVINQTAIASNRVNSEITDNVTENDKRLRSITDNKPEDYTFYCQCIIETFKIGSGNNIWNRKTISRLYLRLRLDICVAFFFFVVLFTSDMIMN